MKFRRHLIWVFVVQAILLVVAAWRNLHQLNPDAIAYIRIAGYYATGQTELAVTGYWGPLLSWLMTPLLLAFQTQAAEVGLLAARTAMVLSGGVFLAGTWMVFRSFRLPPMTMLWGLVVAASYSVFWSVRNITPDLLLAGLVALAVSATVELFLPCRAVRRETQSSGEAKAFLPIPGTTRPAAGGTGARLAWAAGLCWGLAYLAKAVALPLAVMVTTLFAVIGWRSARLSPKAAGRGLLLAWLALLLVAAPWMTVLSWHYGRPTFSTTGSIAHALAGPEPGSRYHPAMVTLHTPDAGRTTQWEEPSRMAYHFWSPFTDNRTLLHQLNVVVENARVMAGWLLNWEWVNYLLRGSAASPGNPLKGFDLAGLSLLALIVGFAVSAVRLWSGAPPQRRAVNRCLASLPVCCLAGLYLPFWLQGEDSRYFYPALPMLWIALAGVWLATKPRGKDSQPARRWGFRVGVALFLFPALLLLAFAVKGLPNPAARAARGVVHVLEYEAVNGPVAGSALLPGGRAGLYTAFLSGEQWLGDDAQAGPEAFAAAGARVVVLRRDARQRAAFERAPGWRTVEPAASIPLLLFIRENP